MKDTIIWVVLRNFKTICTINFHTVQVATVCMNFSRIAKYLVTLA